MKKTLLSILVLSLATSALVFAAAEQEGSSATPGDMDPARPWDAFKDDPITMTMFIDGGWGFPEVTNDPDSWLIKRMIADTGVTIEFNLGGGWGPEGLNLMIASGDYSDLMLLRRVSLPTQLLVDNDQIYSWDEINEMYGIDTCLTEMNINTRFLHRVRYDSEELYLCSFYSIPDRYLDSPYVVKYMEGTMVNEQVYERLGRPPLNSVDDVIDAALKARDLDPQRFQHPIMVSRGAGVEETWNMWKDIFQWKAFYDLSNGEDYNTAGQPHRFFWQTPNFVELLEDVNRMVKLELINPIAWSITDGNEKGAMRYTGEILIEMSEDADNVPSSSQRMGIPGENYTFVPRFSADPAKYNNYPSGVVSDGWLGLAVPKGNDTTLRAAAFAAYLRSEEFQKMQQFGEEGVHHTMVDGRPVVRADVVAEEAADRNAWAHKYGFNFWHGAFRDDFWMAVHKYNKEPAMFESLDIISEGLANFQDTTSSAENAPVTYPADSEELKIYSAIREVLGDEVTRIVLQSDNVEADYQALMDRIDRLGVQTLNDYNSRYMKDFDTQIQKYYH